MIIIEKAATADAQKIRALEKRVWSEEVVNKYDEPMFVRFGYVYVAKDNEKVVGAIVAYPTRDNEVYVCDWVVDKKYRGQGIGMKLYKRLLKVIKGKPVVSFINPNHKASLAAHQKLGFSIVNKVRNPYGLKEGNRIFVRLKP